MNIPLAIRRKSLFVLLVVTLASALIGATVTAPFPESILLPVGFQPEGIAAGDGAILFVGSISTGDIYRIDLLTGQAEPLITDKSGPVAIGLKYDSRSKLLFVAGGPTGKAFIYDTETGSLPHEIQLTTAQPTFINDVVITREAAYFTDSMQPVFYRVPLTANGTPIPEETEAIPLGGDYEFVPGAFNANGIDAVPNGKLLIIVNSQTGDLYTVDPLTGDATLINLGGESVERGDGILLRGKTLYVVQNSLNQIAVVKLSSDFSSGEIVDWITSPLFRVPTTIAAVGNKLYAVNARFGAPSPSTIDYEVVRVPRE
jgi:sugar lactone lactonase YvrE